MGFLVLDEFARRVVVPKDTVMFEKTLRDYLKRMREPPHGPRWEPAGQSYVARIVFNRQDVLLAKPWTYMNLSGTAVRSLLHYFGSDARDMILVFDDVALPWGFIRIREKGSSSGHRGVESIMDALGTDEFIDRKSVV